MTGSIWIFFNVETQLPKGALDNCSRATHCYPVTFLKNGLWRRGGGESSCSHFTHTKLEALEKSKLNGWTVFDVMAQIRTRYIGYVIYLPSPLRTFVPQFQRDTICSLYITISLSIEIPRSLNEYYTHTKMYWYGLRSTIPFHISVSVRYGGGRIVYTQEKNIQMKMQLFCNLIIIAWFQLVSTRWQWWYRQ